MITDITSRLFNLQNNDLENIDEGQLKNQIVMQHVYSLFHLASVAISIPLRPTALYAGVK